MFGSIRWRLVASYALLALLTIGLVGLLALSLVQRYVAQQEAASLRANAEAIAQQAVPLLAGPVHPLREVALYELAQTSAFLGGVQVRILDAGQQPLADSGAEGTSGASTWVIAPVQLAALEQELGRASHPVIMGLPSVDGSMPGVLVPSQADDTFVAELPPGAEYRTVQRIEGPWGSQLVFDVEENQVVIAEGEVMQAEAQAAQAAPSRSASTVMVPVGNTEFPLGYVEVSNGPDFGAEALATMRRAFLGAASGATAIAMLVGLVVSRGLTAPLQNLTLASSRMSAGNLSVRAPVGGSDEIGALAAQFNRMAEQLEASFAALAAERDALRRFIADASHELRTPITALKTFNELLQEAAWEDEATRAEFLKESEAQLARLEWMTHNLLDLSRLDAGLAALDIAPQDAGDLLASATGGLRVQAQEKGVMLTALTPEVPFSVPCDRARVEMALANLVNNAVKFTPAGGHVEVGAELAGEGRARLWVRDDGPGIPQAEQPRIFERFYRGAEQGAEGSGLGLAIVQSVAQAHGGRVWVESEPGQGSLFVMELPTEQAGRLYDVREEPVTNG